MLCLIKVFYYYVLDFINHFLTNLATMDTVVCVLFVLISDKKLKLTTLICPKQHIKRA